MDKFNLDRKTWVKERAFNGNKVLCPFCNKPSMYYEYLDREGGYPMEYECGNCHKIHKPCKSEHLMYDRIIYTEKCKCGKKITVTTQEDSNPEYRTIVGVICPKCNKLVEFSLPVN